VEEISIPKKSGALIIRIQIIIDSSFNSRIIVEIDSVGADMDVGCCGIRTVRP